MAKVKKAAIGLENKKLNEITAAQFLEALEKTGGSIFPGGAFKPEKKKYELWAEPEHFQNLKLGDVFRVFIGEKKKVELEKPPIAERFIDPRVAVRDPEFIKEVAREVAIATKRIR